MDGTWQQEEHKTNRIPNWYNQTLVKAQLYQPHAQLCKKNGQVVDQIHFLEDSNSDYETHVLDATITLNSYITEETTDCIYLMIITVNDFMTMALQNGCIYIYIYTLHKCQEDSMSNSNGGFSV